MTNLKFKVWNKVRNTWFDSELIIITKGGIYANFRDFEDGIQLQDDEFEMILSTGMFDKYRNEIYEGDIVLTNFYDGDAYFKIKYKNGAFTFIRQDGEKYAYEHVPLVLTEIVGNIYDDNDSLEEQK